MDGWKTVLSFWGNFGLFSGSMLVSGRVHPGDILNLNITLLEKGTSAEPNLHIFGTMLIFRGVVLFTTKKINFICWLTMSNGFSKYPTSILKMKS